MPLKLSPGVVEVAGEDARTFLHAIVSSDVGALRVGDSQPSLLLTPSGKLVSTMWIVCVDEHRYVLVSEKESAEVISQSLARLLIRTKATISNVSGNFSALVLHEGADIPEGGVIVENGHLSLTDALLVLVPRTPEFEPTSDCATSYNELRVSWGIVSTQHDLTEDIIPQEAHLEKAISFSKGCFLGQELVCRIDSRQASTPFSFFGLTHESDDIPDSTSERSNNDASIDGFSCGPYVSIARVPRKISESLQSSDAFPVSGYFTV